MTPALTITQFLEARIAEDEAVARAASVSMHGQEHDSQWDYGGYVLGGERDTTPAQDEFITTWWPARVLAECTAKRAVIEAHPPYYADPDYDRSDVLCGTCGLEPEEEYSPPGAVEYPCPTLKALAAVYKDHPDYRQDWVL